MRADRIWGHPQVRRLRRTIAWMAGGSLSPSPDTLTIDEVTFALRWSRKRRTVGITLYPDGRMVVAAPVGCSRRALEQSVRDKLPWVRRKIAQHAALPAKRPHAFADGEEFRYLGRRHRLVLAADGDGGAVPSRTGRAGDGAHRADRGCAVRLDRGRLILPAELAPQARAHLVEWYSVQARRRLPERVSHYARLMAVAPSSVQVKDLGRRWGTCDSHGRVRLHWQIVQFPARIGDYVVVHELAHLHELNHSGSFWDRVEQILPDYRQRKAWLRAHADEYSL